MSDTSQQSELDWLAFQYIADELPADERGAFELRLADDQLAREAVAAAVELSCAIDATSNTAATQMVQVASQQRQTNRSTAWTIVGVAAGLLLAVFAFKAFSPDKPEVVEQDDPATTAELAIAWSETVDEIQADQELNDELVGLNADLSDTDLDELLNNPLDDSLESGDDATPDWLLSALTTSEDDGMETEEEHEFEES